MTAKLRAFARHYARVLAVFSVGLTLLFAVVTVAFVVASLPLTVGLYFNPGTAVLDIFGPNDHEALGDIGVAWYVAQTVSMVMVAALVVTTLDMSEGSR